MGDAYRQVENYVIRNSDGFIAVQHRNSNPTAIQVEDGTIYRWISKHNVSLSWVNPVHLPRVLSEVAKICCGKSDKKFHPASLINVNIWHTGDR